MLKIYTKVGDHGKTNRSPEKWFPNMTYKLKLSVP